MARTCNYSHICTRVLDEPEGFAFREGGHFVGRVFQQIFKATEGNAPAVHHQLRQLRAQFQADLRRAREMSLLSQTRRGLADARAAADLRRLLFRRVLDAVCHFFVGAGGEAGVAAVLSQLSQVRSVLLPLYQDATPQRLKPRSFGTSETTGGCWVGGVGGFGVLYLRRGQILQRLRSEGPGEKFASQDGAQVFGHDGLLLHRAVIFQGQD